MVAGRVWRVSGYVNGPTTWGQVGGRQLGYAAWCCSRGNVVQGSRTQNAEERELSMSNRQTNVRFVRRGGGPACRVVRYGGGGNL